MLDVHAEDALLARMSYTASTESRLRATSKLTVRQIVKVALICSFIVCKSLCLKIDMIDASSE